jgi:hypothetical protein
LILGKKLIIPVQTKLVDDDWLEKQEFEWKKTIWEQED